MQLTIVPNDGTVIKDGLAYSNLTWTGTPPDVHALQWQATSGWIELTVEPFYTPITQLPSWADNALAAWDVANTPVPPTPPTAAENQAAAVSKLASTDWVNQPDVTDPANTPHLLNQSAFLTYRGEIRVIAVTPVAGNIDWPVEPTAVWSV